MSNDEERESPRSRHRSSSSTSELQSSAKDQSPAPPGGPERRETLYWSPFYLRRRTLVGFALIFTCLAVALGIVALYSRRHDGLSTANARDHYFWTYAPTAIFTIVAIFWNETEYRSKQLQPWISMRAGWQPASQSVLLDYISKWNVIALFHSLRRGHVVALFGILGSLLLKLVIVLSTALFALHDVNITDVHASLMAMDAFEVADQSFWEKQSRLYNDQGNDALHRQGDFRPTTAVMAIAENNLKLPEGTTSRQSFQRFALTDERRTNQTLSIQATVDVFESMLQCERATFNDGWIWNGPYYKFTYNATSVSSESCKNGTAMDDNYPGYPWDFDLTNPSDIHSSHTVVRCTQSSTGDDMNSLRMLFYTLDLRADYSWTSPTNSSNDPIFTQSNKGMTGTDFAPTIFSPRFTALLCSPKYEVYQAPVTIEDGAKGTLTPNATREGSRAIVGLDAWNLAEAFLNSIAQCQYFLTAESVPIHGATNWTVAWNFNTGDYGFIWQLLNIVNPQSDIMDWMDSDLLNTTLQSVWSQWSAQMAAYQLKTLTNTTIAGTVNKVQTRLSMQSAPFWLIEACLLTLIGVAAALAAFVPKDVLPRDPASLGGLATLLASSKGFVASVRGVSSYNERRLRNELDRRQFRAGIELHDDYDVSDKFCISQQLAASNESLRQPPVPDTNQWWRPAPFSRLYMVSTPVVLLGLVALLEGLYQLSAKNDGLVRLNDLMPSRDLRFTWTAIPALIMVLVAATVGMLHFTLQTLQPYRLLKRGSATARTSMFKYPYSLFGAFKDRDLPTILTATAVFLGSFLTIVISGLYTAQHVTVTAPVTLKQTDVFSHYTRTSNKSPINIEAVTVGNLSYPRFTHENLVFPSINGNSSATGTVSLQIPALQGVVNCSVFPTEDIIAVNNTRSKDGGWRDVLSIVVADHDNCVKRFNNSYDAFLPASCQDGACSTANANVVIINQDDFGGELPIPPTGHFGYLVWGRNRPRCPHFWGIVGKSTDHLIRESTFFTCSPYVQKVQTDVTFLLPMMDIDRSSPPAILNGSSTSFNVTFGVPPKTTDEAPDPPEGNPILAFEQIKLPSISPNEIFGTFMDILVYGTHGIPAVELVGTANVDRLFKGMDYLYGVGLAQLMNDYRTPLNGSAIPLSGTRSFQGPERLVQNEISTRILESLLCVIVVCVLLAFLLIDTRKVLKHNPCTIAGMASLLAGSELLANIPDGAEWWTDNELMKHPTFEGWVFSLGWWPILGGQKRFGVDIGRADIKP